MSQHRRPPLGQLREERLVRSVHSLAAIAAPLPRVDLRVDASLLLVSAASEALLDGARVVLADVLDREVYLWPWPPCLRAQGVLPPRAGRSET